MPADPPGCSLGQSSGETAFQDVPRVHLHLLPRTRRVLDDVAAAIRRGVRA